MNGYYGHTLKLVNKDGTWVYCQFHLKSDQGIKTLTNDEAAKKSPDYGQADLFNAVSEEVLPCTQKAKVRSCEKY
jgi:catalase